MASGFGQVQCFHPSLCSHWKSIQMYLSVPFSVYLLYFKKRFKCRLMKHLANTVEEVGKMGRRRKERDKCKPGYPREEYLFQVIEREVRIGCGKEGRNWPTVVLQFAQEPRQRAVTSQLFSSITHTSSLTLFLPLPFSWSGRLVFSNLSLANSIQVLKAFKYHLFQRAIPYSCFIWPHENYCYV